MQWNTLPHFRYTVPWDLTNKCTCAPHTPVTVKNTSLAPGSSLLISSTQFWPPPNCYCSHFDHHVFVCGSSPRAHLSFIASLSDRGVYLLLPSQTNEKLPAPHPLFFPWIRSPRNPLSYFIWDSLLSRSGIDSFFSEAFIMCVRIRKIRTSRYFSRVRDRMLGVYKSIEYHFYEFWPIWVC